MITRRGQTLRCTCGATETIEIPAMIREMLQQIRDFVEEHETCEK